MSINSALRWTGLVLAAAVTGALAAKPIVAAVLDRTAIRNGPWRTSLTTGSASANPYERAAVAVAGLYALSQDETIYFTAFTDSDGRALVGACDYRLAGRPLPARWWSVTLYGADHYLVENAAGIHSRHARSLELEADGSYVVAVAAARQPRNWLPAPAGGAFSLTLRLYNPGAALRSDLGAVALPVIAREACR
jgi:hypothetical protein